MMQNNPTIDRPPIKVSSKLQNLRMRARSCCTWIHKKLIIGDAKANKSSTNLHVEHFMLWSQQRPIQYLIQVHVVSLYDVIQALQINAHNLTA